MAASRTSLSFRRVVVIDAIDDLERGAANALLKNLEEPPAGTIFLLVSHAPGRLLPTIRSRCRLLRFERLRDEDVAAVLRRELPDADDGEIAALTRASDGSPGKGLRFAGLDIAGLDAAMAALAADGDRGNGRRSTLAKALAGKAATPRYQAFLDRAPSYIADMARSRTGAPLAAALDAHAAARDLAGAAIGLSLDPQATVFEMGTLIANLHRAA
jgi:DNA polymerase-3 subunit delta'